MTIHFSGVLGARIALSEYGNWTVYEVTEDTPSTVQANGKPLTLHTGCIVQVGGASFWQDGTFEETVKKAEEISFPPAEMSYSMWYAAGLDKKKKTPKRKR